MFASLICSLGAALLYAGTSLFPSSVSPVRNNDLDPNDLTLVTVRIFNNTYGSITVAMGDWTHVIPEDTGYTLDIYPYSPASDHESDFIVTCEDTDLIEPTFKNDYFYTPGGLSGIAKSFPSYGDYSLGWYLPWWEGNCYLEFSNDLPSDGAVFLTSAHFYCSRDHFDKVYVGSVAQTNYDEGYDGGYDGGYHAASVNGVNYDLTLHNESSTSVMVFDAGSSVSDYQWSLTPLFANSSRSVTAYLYSEGPLALDWFLPGYDNVFYVDCPTNKYLSFKYRASGSSVYYDLDCRNHGSSSSDPVCLPYWEGDVELYVYVQSHMSDGYVARDTYFAVGIGYLSGVSCGSAYQSGYDNGYDAATLVDNGVYFQWDTSVYNTDRSYSVKWSCGGVELGSASLSYYNASCYFNRPHGDSYSFSITPNVAVPFTITYSASGTGGNITQVITSDVLVDGVVYLPFWEGSITLTVTPDDTANSSISSYAFSLSNANVDKIRLGYGYSAGYSKGYADGKQAATFLAYMDGYTDGVDTGYDHGHEDGYDEGHGVGYNEGYEAGYEAGGGGDATIEVVDFWGLFSGVVSMPFTFFSQGLDWTLFAGSQYEFNVSAFIGTLFVGLMLWKIISLIVGVWGGKV